MEDNMYNISGTENNDDSNLAKAGLRKPTVTQVSVLYSIAVILLLIPSKLIYKLPINDTYLKSLLAEVILIAVPPLIFLFIFKFDIKKVLRFKKISFLNLFIVFCIMVFALPAVGALNAVNMLLINLIFGKTLPTGTPQIANYADLIKGVIAIGLSAGVCEEILFRGTIQRGFEKLGAIKAIIITAFLFGLMHHDFQRFLGTFLLGAIIGFIVYRSDSIFGGMLAHFTNNTLVVFLSFGLSKFSEFTKSSGLAGANGEYDTDKYFSQILNGPKVQLIAAIFMWTMMFLIAITAFIAIMYAFIRNTSKISRDTEAEKGEFKLSSFLWVLPGIALIFFIYFAQVLELKGIEIGAVKMILKFIGF